MKPGSFLRLASRVLRLCLLLGLPAGCAVAPLSPERAACLERMNRHSAELLPGFAALGYRPEVRLQLDEEMRDGRGFRLPDQVLGDAQRSGRIRLRAPAVCGNPAVARAVVAHEMAHVALHHLGTAPTGVVLAWEKPAPQEIEADRLALAVLRRTGGHPASERFIECHLSNCAAAAPAAWRGASPPRAGAAETGRAP